MQVCSYLVIKGLVNFFVNPHIYWKSNLGGIPAVLLSFSPQSFAKVTDVTVSGSFRFPFIKCGSFKKSHCSVPKTF